jgi:hypothetical protein
MYTTPSKTLSIILAISLSLSLAAIVIIPISIYHEASAKECNDNTANDQNNGDNPASSGSTCSDKQDSSSNNKHSVTEDKTPFVLATPVPFP